MHYIWVRLMGAVFGASGWCANKNYWSYENVGLILPTCNCQNQLIVVYIRKAACDVNLLVAS